MKSIHFTIEMNKKKNKVLIIVDRMINIDDSKVNEQSLLKQKWSFRSIPMTSIYFYQSSLFRPLLFSLSFFSLIYLQVSNRSFLRSFYHRYLGHFHSIRCLISFYCKSDQNLYVGDYS